MNIVSRFHGIRAARYRWLVPVISTAVLYVLGYGVPALFFGIYIKPERIPFDFGLQLILAILVFTVSRRIWAFLLLQTLLVGVLYVGSAIKTALLGRPIMPEDMHNISALIRILGPLGWLLVGLPLALICSLFLFNLRLRGSSTKAAWGLLLAMPVTASVGPGPKMLEQALDQAFNNFPWDQRQNYIERGGTLNFVQESVRAMADRKPAPQEAEVRAAVARRETASGARVNLADLYAPGDEPYRRKRNIHMILEESFWDPSLLTAAHFNQPPLDPRFVDLWRQTGFTHALSPAFGGQTANAEFEMLCGFPLNEVSVKFEYGLKNAVPCLPRLLDKAGYRSIASHPNLPAFWNRQVAFKLIGFETFWAGTDFKMDDLGGDQYLSDRSLHAQVAAKLAESQAATNDQRPVFDYIVSIFGHWPYPPSAGRPDVITSDTAVEEVLHYANAVYYKSREMMDEIERLRRSDPDSLIVIFGDHLPSLGPRFAGYTESGRLAPTFGEFSATDYAFSASTPLIVIDGRRGPLQLGAMPMYRMPRLIMDLIGEDGPAMFDLAAPPVQAKARPLPGVMLTYNGDRAGKLCRDDDAVTGGHAGNAEGSLGGAADCAGLNAWLEDVLMISRDIFSGQGHALKLIGGAAIAGGNGGNDDHRDGTIPDVSSAVSHFDDPATDDGSDALSFKPGSAEPAGSR